MATGACGIDCGKCRLFRRGICSSCGGGLSDQGAHKIETQERILGAPCPILACAGLNRINHCMADCDSFPCDNFRVGPYPFSKGFLDMQQRRRQQFVKQNEKEVLQLPDIHWDCLDGRDVKTVCRITGAQHDKEHGFSLPMLEEDVQVSPAQRKVLVYLEGRWHYAPYLQSLVALVYLSYAIGMSLKGQWVTEKDLKCASFFRGPHILPFGDIMDRFGSDLEGFVNSGKKLGAMEVEGADAGLRFMVLPKIPIKLLLWAGDEDLPPAVTFLFDRSIEEYLPADGIWALANFLTDRLARS